MTAALLNAHVRDNFAQIAVHDHRTGGGASGGGTRLISPNYIDFPATAAPGSLGFGLTLYATSTATLTVHGGGTIYEVPVAGHAHAGK